jgi:nitrous oxide reductase accessory protein NosL
MKSLKVIIAVVIVSVFAASCAGSREEMTSFGHKITGNRCGGSYERQY